MRAHDKTIISVLSFLFLLLFNHSIQSCDISIQEQKKFVFIVCSYNNKDWYEKNLDSIFSQKYPNYRVIYIDDCSIDDTGNLIEAYIKDNSLESKTTLIRNKSRCLALANIYNAVYSCDDNEIVVLLDGDDWLARDDVLSLLNEVYSDPDVWITYGNYEQSGGGVGSCCRPMHKGTVKNNSYRKELWAFGHLRTFYAWLFKKIKLEDFLYQGQFFPMAWDLAIMVPSLIDKHKYYPLKQYS